MSALIPELPSPIALTLGVFDGVHLGHQALLTYMRSLVGPEGSVVVITFRNHPQELLRHKQIPLIVPLAERLRLLRAAGADLVHIIDFTPEIAALSYEAFLKHLRASFPFEHLVLGKGATFGHKAAGDEAHIKALESSLKFTAHYLPKLELDGTPISSQRIRALLASGDRTAASRLLGR